MSADSPGSSAAAFVDLEFDTGARGGASLGDIASSLVTIDELLRDLASIEAEPSAAEFRKIEITSIEMRSPLRIRLSLFSIAAEAVQGFQDICRRIIVGREPAAALPERVLARISDDEARRLHGHIASLQHAAIPLKRVEVKRA